MYALNGKKEQKTTVKNGVKRVSKECAYLAVFVALVIAAQLCLAAIPSVEVVTVLFIAYSFSFGGKRGMIAATLFSFLRMFLYGVFFNVLLLYLVYFNLLALLFGFLGGRVKNPVRSLWWLTAVACLCTVCFSLLDNIITPLWYGYTGDTLRAYFFASLTVMLPQVACTAVTVGVLFLPLERVFRLVKF